MWMRATRWAVAAFVGSAMTAVGCSNPRIAAHRDVGDAHGVVADDSLVPAFDTNVEARLVDRIELDHFLRDRDIRVQVVDGVVRMTGEVWTPLEKERAGDLIRHVVGVIDVDNDLDVRPPR